MTGKKVEMYSLPYSSINMWSSENGGRLLDFNAELELWTRAGRQHKGKVQKGVDIRGGANIREDQAPNRGQRR